MLRYTYSPLLYLLFYLLRFCLHTSAQSTTSAACGRPAILSALQANTANGSDIFCSEYLQSVSLVGTLREDPTFLFSTTVTNTKSVDPVYVYKSTTTKEVVTSTIYESQRRTSANFTQPLPSYVEQYGTAAVSKACSCFVGPASTYTQYRVCEQATTTTTISSTFTFTVGRPGKTSTYTDVSTKTKLKSTTLPYPSTCPGADNIDYVASDSSPWERGCGTYLECYRPLDTVQASSLDACIEKCVDYNTALGYKQCQAVIYDPKSNNCIRGNEPCYWGHYPGSANCATLKFYTPSSTLTNFCSTVSGATPCTTTSELYCSTV